MQLALANFCNFTFVYVNQFFAGVNWLDLNRSNFDIVVGNDQAVRTKSLVPLFDLFDSKGDGVPVIKKW